jgi:hypothetical protein
VRCQALTVWKCTPVEEEILPASSGRWGLPSDSVQGTVAVQLRWKAGKLTPVIDRTVPLAQSPEAIRCTYTRAAPAARSSSPSEASQKCLKKMRFLSISPGISPALMELRRSMQEMTAHLALPTYGLPSRRPPRGPAYTSEEIGPAHLWELPSRMGCMLKVVLHDSPTLGSVLAAPRISCLLGVVGEPSQARTLKLVLRLRPGEASFPVHAEGIVVGFHK